MEYFIGMMHDVDLLFYGRIMYQLMFHYWADVAKDGSCSAAEVRFAERLVSIDKVVVSDGLVDEFHLVVHLVMAGTGRHLLSASSLPKDFKLQLLETKTFKNGCVAFHYLKRE